MPDADAIESALEALRPGFAADGFELRIGSSTDDGGLQVILEAGPTACLECLVPEHLLIRIVEDALREQGVAVKRLELVKRGFEG